MVWDWITTRTAVPLGLGQGTELVAYACNHCAQVDWSLDGAERVVPDGRRLQAVRIE